MKIKNPSYYIKLKMAECLRIISVNGIEIERDLSGSTNYSEYPINHFIKNGENSFALMVAEEEVMTDMFTPRSECTAEVRVRGEIDQQKVDFKVTDITFSADYSKSPNSLIEKSSPSGDFVFQKENVTAPATSGKDFSVGEVQFGKKFFDGAEVLFERTFTAAVPFETWTFFNAEKVFNTPILTDDQYDAEEAKIIPIYKDLIKTFETRNLDKILPLFELRSNEIDQAFYKEPGTTHSELKQSLERVFTNNFPLIEKQEEHMEMVLSHDGRLATLLNAADMAGTIHFRDTDNDMVIFYSVYWAKKDGKWFIAR